MGQRKNIILNDIESGAELHAHLRDLVDLVTQPNFVPVILGDRVDIVYTAKLKVYYSGGGHGCRVWKGKEDV